MFEHKTEELLPLHAFAARMARSFGVVACVGAGSLLLGTVGYCYYGNLTPVDGLLNASMILTGMGPVDHMTSTSGKLFSSFYALYSGVAFLSMMAVLTAPVFHRIMHKFHLEEEEDDNNAAPKDRS